MPQVPLSTFWSQQMDFIFRKDADPRTEVWPLMETQWPTIFLCFSYLFTTMWIGPWFMKGKKPMKLKEVMMIYNAFQVCFNFWISTMIIRGFYINNYSFVCQPIDKSTTPNAMLITRAAWWFYISKYVDYFDTLFFILRKRYDHITVLHIGHHGVIAFPAWYAVKFIPGGNLTLLALQNSSIHVIMYFYYFMAGMGPQFQKYLWWKKYLTIVQIGQFIFLLIHQSQLFFIECDFPAYPRYWGLFFGPLLILFFFNFYIESYGNRNINKRTFAQHFAAAIPCHNMQMLNDADTEEKNFQKEAESNLTDLTTTQQLTNRSSSGGIKRAGGEQ